MLGHGDEADRHTPMIIEALRGVKVSSIATGVATSLLSRSFAASETR
jgi:hypothetical protein